MECPFDLKVCDTYCNEKQIFPAMRYFIEKLQLSVNAAAFEVSKLTHGLVTQGRARQVWNNRIGCTNVQQQLDSTKETEEIREVDTEPYSAEEVESVAVDTFKEVKKIVDKKKKARQKEKRESLKPTELPQGKFQIIYADPPWRYEFSSTTSRDIENQYPTMSLDEIKELPIQKILADDSVLFLWVTSPKLIEGLEVLSSWGFQYVTCAVWDKLKIGMGYYFRQQHELLLIGKRGSLAVPDPSARVSSVISSPREKHSKKPDIVYEIIEKMYPNERRIELFSRQERQGWKSYGNENQ